MYPETVDSILGLSGIDDQMIEGVIEAVARRNPAMSPAQKTRAAIAQTIQMSAAKTTATRGQLLALNSIDKFPADLQTKIRNGLAKLEDVHLYVRKNIAQGTGIQKLILETTQKAAGVTNINGNKVEVGLAALITGLRVTTASSATITDPSLVPYSNVLPIGVTAVTNTPVSLANADVVIKKNSVEVYRAPVSKFLNPGGSYASIPGQYDTVQLNNAILLTSNDTLGAEIEFSAAASLPVAQNFVQVELLGVGIRG
jgi:hypothetical protein